MRNTRVLDMVYLSLFLTIIIVMAWIPNLGYINLGFMSATILHIPVIIASIYFGKKLGTLTGLAFGISSLVIAFIRPSDLMAFFYQNPLISVLPRVLFAFLTVLIYKGLSPLIKNKYITIPTTAFLGSLTHSLLVLGMLATVYYDTIMSDDTVNNIFIWFAGIFFTVSMIEAVVSSLIVTPIVIALQNLKGEEE